MKKERLTALLVCAAMLLGLCPLYPLPVLAAAGLPQNTADYTLPGDKTPENMQTYNQSVYGLQYGVSLVPVQNAASATPGKTIDGTDIPAAVSDYVLDIEQELILKKNPAAPDVRFISVDGGTRFKPIKSFPVTGMDLSRVLGKNAVAIVLITDLDTKTKEPAAYSVADAEKGIKASVGSVQYTFPMIQPRPALPKLSINYYALRDATGETNGAWTLAANKTPLTDLTGYELAPVGSNPHKPDEAGWATLSAKGVNVLSTTSAKRIKTKFLARIAPKASPLTPASKIKKLSAISVAKPPSYKVDYKKELIKVKADAIYTQGAPLWSDPDSTAETPDYLVWKSDTSLVPFTKDGAKSGLPLRYTESGADASRYGQTLLFRTLPPASGKKPASGIQSVTLADTPTLLGGDLKPSLSKGKFVLPKGYEAQVDGKWKTSIPAGTTAAVVRIKNSAKYNVKADTTSGTPASNTITLSLGNGNYDIANMKKTGIVTYGVIEDPHGFALAPKGIPLVQNVTSQSALDAITKIEFQAINSNAMPTGSLRLDTNLVEGEESAFYEPTLSGTTINVKTAALKTGRYTFSLKLEDEDGLPVEGFFCPVVVINVINPSDPTKVTVTLDESIYEDTDIKEIHYSVSGAVAAIDGLNFPKSGVKVSMNATIYIYIKRVSGGQTQTQTLSYKAVLADGETGKVLGLQQSWSNYTTPTCSGAVASASGMSITLTFSENVSLASNKSITVAGGDWGSNAVQNVRIDSSQKTKVIISLKNALEKDDVITVGFTETGIKTVGGHTFTSGTHTVDTTGIAEPTPTPSPTAKPTLPPTPSAPF